MPGTNLQEVRAALVWNSSGTFISIGMKTRFHDRPAQYARDITIINRFIGRNL